MTASAQTSTIAPEGAIDTAALAARTARRVKAHPLDLNEIRDVVLEAWDDIFASSLGGAGLRIGTDIMLSPQNMSNLLHEFIPALFAKRYPDQWRKDNTADEKDLVCIESSKFSCEIKCSSSASSIYGNRSYAQPDSQAKKSKDGYYIAVNFERFQDVEHLGRRPEVTLIRFGWLEHTDWVAQASSSGQQATLRPEAKAHKLVEVYRRPKMGEAL